MSDAQRDILVLTLGGTIDAQPYPEDTALYPANAIPSGQNAAFEALKSMCDAQHRNLTHIKLCDKDSKDLNADDINALCGYINNASGYERIIVTMGTDKMRETALTIKSHIPHPPCPIIFTGAIWPISNGAEKTDAFENLELALSQKNTLENGTYIAMSGYCAPPEDLIKDFSKKRFDLFIKNAAQ